MCSQSFKHFTHITSFKSFNNPMGRYHYLPPFTYVDTEAQRDKQIVSKVTQLTSDEIGFESSLYRMKQGAVEYSVILSKLSTRFIGCPPHRIGG